MLQYKGASETEPKCMFDKRKFYYADFKTISKINPSFY